VSPGVESVSQPPQAHSGEPVFVLKKSDIIETTVQSKLYIYKCPLCGKTITSAYMSKALAAAKLHLERAHSLKVVVEKQ
jgi:uncharacterized protein (UPF0212 family)